MECVLLIIGFIFLGSYISTSRYNQGYTASHSNDYYVGYEEGYDDGYFLGSENYSYDYSE